LSGVLESDRNDLLDRALEAQHGDAIAEVQELERAVELAERSVELSRQELAREANISLEEFNRLAEPLERAVAPPWLKKETENGVEVVRALDRKSRGWLKATPEQIETGQYFETWQEYNAAHGRPAHARVEDVAA
jgi:hypothetical protein